MTALPGTPLSEVTCLTPTRLGRALRQVSEHLRTLHALTATECLGRSEFGDLGAHRPLEPKSTWLDSFRVTWNKLLDDVVTCGCYSAGEADTLRQLFDRHREHFAHPVAPSCCLPGSRATRSRRLRPR